MMVKNELPGSTASDLLITPDIGTDSSVLKDIYGDGDSFELFKKSYAKRVAYRGNKAVGAVRIISEGVETALMVDLKTVWDSDEKGQKINDTTDAGERKRLALETRLALLTDIETDLEGRRVMAYGTRTDLEAFEKAGYGRCKNAWVLYRNGMDESAFLPPAYKYENEFKQRAEKKPPRDGAAKKEWVKAPKITYSDNREEADIGDINEVLTEAFHGKPRDIRKTEQAFDNSPYAVFAYDGVKLVGVARAVADGKKYATILNVAVRPDYQGLAIGKNLVHLLEENIKEERVVLNTHPKAVGFYNRMPELRRTKYIFERRIKDETEDETRIPNIEFLTEMFTPPGYRFPDEY